MGTVALDDDLELLEDCMEVATMELSAVLAKRGVDFDVSFEEFIVTAASVAPEEFEKLRRLCDRVQVLKNRN